MPSLFARDDQRRVDSNMKIDETRPCTCADNSYTKDVGIGVCMKCGRDSCSWYGCFVRGCNCKREKVSRR